MVYAAFYATFDDRTGPTVQCEEPAGAFEEGSEGRRTWELYSDYVMSGNPQLDGRLVQVRAGRDAVLCLPVVLRDDEKYPRNAFLFSLGVVVPGESLESANRACRGTLQRLAQALRAMELESSLLSKGEEAKRWRRLMAIVPDALRTILIVVGAGGEPRRPFQLNSTAAELLEQDPNVFSLRRPWRPRSKVEDADELTADKIQQWQVPVLLARPKALLRLSAPGVSAAHSQRAGDDAWDDRERRTGDETLDHKSHESDAAVDHERGATDGAWDNELASDDAWDLAVQQVIPHVDGVRNVRQVASASHMDVDIVCKCLRVLLHFRCLTVMDKFQFSNVYRVTQRAGELAVSPDALDACAQFVLKCPPDELDYMLREEAAAEHSVSSGEGNEAKEVKAASRMLRRAVEPAAVRVLRLYCDFCDGRSVKDVLLAASEDSPQLIDSLDHHGFATFGVLHGILRRVHHYPIALPNVKRSSHDMRASFYDNLVPQNRHDIPTGDHAYPKARSDIKPTLIDMASGHRQRIHSRDSQEGTLQMDAAANVEATLGNHWHKGVVDRILQYMDGSHCMDEICTDLEMSPKHVLLHVRRADHMIFDVFR